MTAKDDEEERLRSVALQNAQSILLARQRAEEALRRQSEWLRVTLSSIGDGVISTDAEGRVTFLNSVAESLTGWPQAEALGRPLPEIFHIVNEHTRQPVENPALRALTEGAIVGLANHSVLIARDRTERPIDDSAAPIREGGGVLGAVLVFREVTEQRRAERERQESEERFRSLVVATSQIVWTTDPDGKVVDDCPSWRAFTGQTYEQWKGSGWLDAIHPDDRERTAQVWRQCVQDKCICQTEYRLRRHDGSYRWTAVRAVPVLEAGGRIREWVGMNTDITERKEAEALLSAQKDALEMLAAGAPLMQVLDFFAGAVQTQRGQAAMVAIHLLDESGTRFAQTAAPSLPPSYAQATDGMEVSSGVGPCCAAISRRQRVVVADIAASPEFAAFAAFASPLGIRAASSAPIFSSTGKVLGTVANYYREVRLPHPQDDVFGEVPARTVAIAIERKQAEEALRQGEERFRMLADNMAQLAWTCDLLGNVTWYNQRWLEYTGLTFEDMKGWDWSKVQHPDHLDRVVARVKRSAETGEPWEDTFPLRGKDGNYRWFLSCAVPILDATGTIVRWFGTNTDVTELRDAQDTLREADRRKDEFLALLAHELRNPLAPISNAAQVLRRAGRDAGMVHSASEVLERQVGQMARLVDDLLDMSRITRGKIELRRQHIELAPVLNQAVEAARPLVQSMEHELTLTVPPQPIYLDADPVRLIQMVGNLLNNACKFMDKGGRIALTVERQGQHALIRVRDSGIGIAADQLPRIFKMFMQVDTSLERSVSGLGIGLTLVRNVVEMHGGTIDAHSDGLGQGSEFVVRLPILFEPPGLPSRPTVGEPTSTTGRRILIVDDNQDGAESLALLLTLGGHETHIAQDGLEAIDAAEQLRPDVVLLDIGLPRLNGYEVCRRIREQGWGKDVVLVAVTGWGQEEDRDRSRDAGFNTHIVKPVDHDVLIKLLASLPARRTAS